MADAVAISNIIRDRIKRAGLTIEEVATMSGVSYATLHRLLHTPESVRLSTLIKVCKALDIELMPFDGGSVDEQAGQKFNPCECCELIEKVLKPLSENKPSHWTLYGIKYHVRSCPTCRKSLVKINRLSKKGGKTDQDKVALMVITHFVGAEEIRCPYCRSKVIWPDKPMYVMKCNCSALYVADPYCNPDKVRDVLKSFGHVQDERILHNVVPNLCMFDGDDSNARKLLHPDTDRNIENIRKLCVQPKLVPPLWHLHFGRVIS